MNIKSALIICFSLSCPLYASLTKSDASLKSPLRWKVSCEEVAWLKTFDKEIINEQNFFKYTALHCALGANGAKDTIFKTYSEETVKIINFLLAHNADPNIRNVRGHSPFLYLILYSCDSDSLVRSFLKFKADPNMYDRERTTLHYCETKNMSIERLKLLLTHNANPCLTVKKYPYTGSYLNIIDGQYAYEIAEDKEKRNLLLHAIPSWILAQRKNVVTTFLLCMNYHKKSKKIARPPRFLQYNILGIMPLVNVFKEIEKMQKKEVLNEKEKMNIKNMIDQLITGYDKR